MSKMEYKDLIAFHPGYYLKDIIEDMGITQDEFAKRLNTTGKHLSDLLNGKCGLSKELALNLSIMFGTTLDVWLNLQKTYTEKVLEIERMKAEDNEVECVNLIDYSFFVNLGVVPKRRLATDKVRELLKYFKISSFEVFKQPDFLVSYRTAIQTVSEKNIINSNAWVQTAINIGKEKETKEYNSKRLRSHLDEIRGMTIQDPKDFYPRLVEIFASCGIAFVSLPHLQNSGVNGAIKWLNKEKVILAINDRRKYLDTFWFCLFHEIGHVLQEKITMLIVSRDMDEMDEINKALEDDANRFAQDILLPEKAYAKLINNNDFSEGHIREFAAGINIHPGIVVGRLQKENYIGFDRLTGLKGKYVAAVFKI